MVRTDAWLRSIRKAPPVPCTASSRVPLSVSGSSCTWATTWPAKPSTNTTCRFSLSTSHLVAALDVSAVGCTPSLLKTAITDAAATAVPSAEYPTVRQLTFCNCPIPPTLLAQSFCDGPGRKPTSDSDALSVRTAAGVGQCVGQRHRPGEQEALRHLALESMQLLELRLRLHTFGDGRESEFVRQRQDQPDELTTAAFGIETVDEAAIDLDEVASELAQQRQVRVAGAEVVDGDAHAEAVQLVELRFGGDDVGHHDVFRDLDRQGGCTDTGAGDGLGHVLYEVAVVELGRREVDRHA